ncbi:helix-turn-helix domain-containing protein [Flammeovirga pectinis]|uniref:Helix-turn-helix domain-containing protein n=1 Tax=Flammeovirga pectinis TaxID=2494373 RepID=A0A3S9NXW3_9BACT|nr:helix-turn-helix transcriptional regulator [Flammeovirga pectinis]AZQ60705.1 helix-turn-helix domain-containing protein [Flammeovirga pectinis]
MELTVKDKSANLDIKIEPFRSSIRTTKPHKHYKYFEVIFLSEGKGYHTIDNDTYEIKPPVLFFMRKEQMHHWEITTPPKGYVIIMKKSFLEHSIDKQLENFISEISNHVCVEVEDEKNLTQIFELLVEESKNPSKYQQSIIEGLLKALFAKTLINTKPIQSKLSNLPPLYAAFKELLENNDNIKNSVNYYAEILHTTPQNLNAICRNAIGLSASKLIAEYIIKEAKRFLLYTNLPVSEIAYELGFKDNSHFIKYFKRNTEQTPAYFRSQKD